MLNMICYLYLTQSVKKKTVCCFTGETLDRDKLAVSFIFSLYAKRSYPAAPWTFMFTAAYKHENGINLLIS